MEPRQLLAGNVWTQRGGDAGHSGYVDVAVDPSMMTDAWDRPLSYVPSGTDSWNEWAVAIDGTQVYRTEADLQGAAFGGTYHVIAYDLADGTVRWDRPIRSEAFAGVGEPSVADGVVYVNAASHSGTSGIDVLPTLYGLDAGTGAIVTSATYSAQWASNERPVIEGGQLIDYDGYYGGFGSWSTTHGLTLQWRHDGPQLIDLGAAMDAQDVYIYGNQVYSRATGARLPDMTHPLGLTLTSPIVSASGKVLYSVAGTVGGVPRTGIAAFDGATGDLLWTAYTDEGPVAKAAGHGVVAVAAGSQLLTFNEDTGAPILAWHSFARPTGELILTRTHAFVETTSGSDSVATVQAINLATGQPDWSFTNRELGGSGSAAMEIALAGGKLVLSHDAFVRAFNVFPAGDNQAPTAVGDSATTREDEPVRIAVTSNDSGPDGHILGAIVVSGPAHGTVKVNADGTVTYTPAFNYNGPDSFTYRATDGKSQSNIATVALTVTPVNDAPLASDDSYALASGATLSVAARGVLANDTDAEGDPLTATLATPPAHGTLTLNPDGSFTFVPAPGFSGTDRFTYRAGDGGLTSAPAVVQLAVTSSPVALQFGAASYRVAEGSGVALVTVTRSGGTEASVSVEYATAPGTAVAGADFTPFAGTLTFGPGVTSQTISIPITNDASAEGDESFAVTLSGSPAGVILGNPASTTVTIVDDDSAVPAPDPARVIGLKRFGYHAQPTALVISFDEALDPSRATDASLYVLTQPGPDRRLGTRDDRTVPIAAATYDPAARAVVLRPARRLNLFLPYQLRIAGTSAAGLTDRSGNLLDGDADGRPGGDFVARFDRHILAGRAAELRAVDGPERVLTAGATAIAEAPLTRAEGRAIRAKPTPTARLLGGRHSGRHPLGPLRPALPRSNSRQGRPISGAPSR